MKQRKSTVIFNSIVIYIVIPIVIDAPNVFAISGIVLAGLDSLPVNDNLVQSRLFRLQEG